MIHEFALDLIIVFALVWLVVLVAFKVPLVPRRRPPGTRRNP